MIDDLPFIQKLLPQYDCKEESSGAIRCKSIIGIWEDKEWAWFKNKVVVHFKKRFKEIYHEVNHDHKDFYIYFKPLTHSNEK